MSVSRHFVNICSDKIAETRDFYVNLFGFSVAFDSDWFVQLKDSGSIELGILQRDHELVPPEFRNAPQGFILTFVVDDADKFHAKALQLGARIVEAPRDMFYGQRRMLMSDPNGTLIDVSAPIPAR